MVWSSYTFAIIRRETWKLDERHDFSLTAKKQDIAVAAIVVYKNQNFDGCGIVFPSDLIQGSKVLDILRSNPTWERLVEYYQFLKSNESDIMATMKTIRKI